MNLLIFVLLFLFQNNQAMACLVCGGNDATYQSMILIMIIVPFTILIAMIFWILRKIKKNNSEKYQSK